MRLRRVPCRFCQKIGCKGFPDLKASIASEFMPVALKGRDSDATAGSFKSLKDDFLAMNSRAIDDTCAMLSEEDVGKAVELLANAKRIFLMGVGSSGIVALDVQMKLLRLGFNVVYQSDPNFLTMLGGLAGHDDALLAISYTGETEETCRVAKHFKRVGGAVVSIGKFPSSRLGRLSDVILRTASEEDVFRIGAMSSRLAQMFISDFLVISLAMRDMGKCQESILKTHSMLKDDH